MDLETPITTQEQLDSIISEKVNQSVQGRLTREAKKYEGYTSPDDLAKLKADYDKQIRDLNGALTVANEKAAKYDTDIAERDARIKGYETDSVKTRIAHEAGLPYEMHSRLNGETEDEIRKDADSLAKLMKANNTAPMAAAERPVGKQDSKKAAYKELLDGINNNN